MDFGPLFKYIQEVSYIIIKAERVLVSQLAWHCGLRTGRDSMRLLDFACCEELHRVFQTGRYFRYNFVTGRMPSTHDSARTSHYLKCRAALFKRRLRFYSWLRSSSTA